MTYSKRLLQALLAGIWFGLPASLLSAFFITAFSSSSYVSGHLGRDGTITVVIEGVSAFFVGTALWWKVVTPIASPGLFRGAIVGASTAFLTLLIVPVVMMLSDVSGMVKGTTHVSVDDVIALVGYALLFFGWLAVPLGAFLGFVFLAISRLFFR